MNAWMRVSVGGQRWRVYLVSPRSKYLRDEDDHTNKLDGQCFYDRCAIYIDRTLEESVFEDTLLHELMHAVLHVTGASAVYGREPELEERLVSAATPALHRLVRDLGFHFPKRAA